MAAATVALGAPPALAATTGPDVSNWQHPGGAAIDWGAVRAAGHSFAFVKATEGPHGSAGGRWYTNPYFAGDWRAAARAGLARGAYHYAQPGRPVARDAAAQARYYVSVTGTMHGARDLPPVLDLEESDGLSPAELVGWARAWLAEVQRLTGRRPMVYTYLNFWRTAMGDTSALTGYKLWFARYTSDPRVVRPPGGWPTWTFWQYTAAARVPGIPGAVDVSRFCCAVGTLRALADGGAASAFASNPFGALDGTERRPGGLLARGWAIDPDTTDAVRVDAYVDGHFRASLIADGPGADVEHSYPGFGPQHRFAGLVGVSGGRHRVCLYAVNIGYGHGNPRLDCRLVSVPATPYGRLDSVTRVPGGLALAGWAVDPDVADPLWVHVAVDGRVVTAFHAGLARPDVGSSHPGYGDDHGFGGVLPLAPPGRHRVCAYAINQASGTTNPVLGCRTVTVSTAPVGALDGVERTATGLHVHGWAVDPGTADPVPVTVTVDGAAAGTLTADAARPDVGRAFPGWGDEHGFDGEVLAPAGGHRVCAQVRGTTLGCAVVR